MLLQMEGYPNFLGCVCVCMCHYFFIYSFIDGQLGCMMIILRIAIILKRSLKIIIIMFCVDPESIKDKESSSIHDYQFFKPTLSELLTFCASHCVL